VSRSANFPLSISTPLLASQTVEKKEKQSLV
jgi:hypothetical protein